MNTGGDPDDYGLPPVDIEIPDDARELDEDVRAYHRQLRGRRRMLTRRAHAPLRRKGATLPLVACCLALVLLGGILLAVLTATHGPFGPAPSPAGQSGQSAAVGHVGGPLPNANVLVGGEQTPLRSLYGSVLAVVPPACQCEAALGRLTHQAEGVGARVYVVGVEGEQVAGLARRVGLRAAQAVEDAGNVLVTYYHPAGLTAILVSAQGTVTAVVPVQGNTARLQRALHALPSGGSPQSLGSPGGGTPPAATTVPPGLWSG